MNCINLAPKLPKLTGKLAKAPPMASRVLLNMAWLKVHSKEIEDWSYPAEGKQIGGWSIAVFLKRNPELKDKLPVYEQPQ